MTSQIYWKVITSHYFNDCHLKEVRWLLSEMLITAWSLVCYCRDFSFPLDNSREGIMGNFNKKICTESTISAIHLELLRHGATAGYRQLLVLKVVVSLYYISTTSVATGRSGSNTAMCGRALSELKCSLKSWSQTAVPTNISWTSWSGLTNDRKYFSHPLRIQPSKKHVPFIVQES